MRAAIVALVVIVAWSSYQTGRTKRPDTRPDKGSLLENLTWPDAERLLSPETVVVIPVGAASLEHGPHLKLGASRRCWDADEMKPDAESAAPAARARRVAAERERAGVGPRAH